MCSILSDVSSYTVDIALPAYFSCYDYVLLFVYH